MPRLLRTALVACTAMLALAFAGSAMAAFTPKLVISHASYARGNSASTTVSLTANQNDDSIAKITIYSAAGYGATLSQAVGTQLGTVHARAQAKAISPDAILTIDGVVRVADQNDASIKQASLQCTGSATHNATWLLALQAAGTPLNIPVFVDQTAGAEAAFASYKMQICLTSPEIPQSAGGAPFGAKVLEATLVLNNVFTNPSSAGEFVWTAIVTPYVPNTGTPNPAGTVETRAIVRIPQTLGLKASFLKKGRSVRLSGTLSEGAGTAVSGQRVTLYVGPTAAKLKASGSATTGATGAFRFTRKSSKRTLVFQVRAASDVRNPGAAACASPKAPAGCVGATLNPISVTSRVVKVKGRKR